MKQLLMVVLAAGVLASCNNSSNATKDIKDSLDSVTKQKTESINNSAKQAIDTIKKANDSLKNRIDTAGKRIHDSLNKSK